MNRVRRVAVAALLLLTAELSHAYRQEYLVTLDGKRKSGSEVCFYGGDVASDPLALFFTYGRVACLPAGKVLDFPPGLFHVFARHADGYVSSHRDFVVNRDAPAPEAGYEMLEIPLERAAYVSFERVLPSLRAGQSVGIWLAETPRRSGSTFFPLVDGEATAFVPAHTPFVPLLIEKGAIVAIGEPEDLEPAERHVAEPFRGRAGTVDVVAWTRLDRTAAASAEGPLAGPEIVLVQGDRRIAPLFRLLDPSATFTLMIFRGAAPGAASLRVEGKTWARAERRVQLASGTPVVFEREPLLLAPAAAIQLTWGTAGAAGAATNDCTTADVERPEIRAMVRRCDAAGCAEVARQTASYEPAGSMSIAGVRTADSRYELVITPPFRDPIVMAVELKAGREVDVVVPIEGLRFYGTVRRNGKPLRGTIVFESGVAYSDETGSYAAALAGDPAMNLVKVLPCGESRTYRHVARERILPNRPYDIDIRTRTIAARVQDAASGSPLAGVQVGYAPVRDSGSAAFFLPAESLTDAKGEAAFEAVESEHRLEICAQLEGYDPACSEAAKDVTVLRLQRLAREGKVVGHTGVGLIAWFDPAGRITEQAQVAPDGTFRYRTSHAPPELVAYTSDSRPLTILPVAPRAESDGPLTLAMPAAPVRSFAVSVPSLERGAGFVGLWVGGAYVPLEVLAAHQDSRGSDVRIEPGQRLVMRDILETAPLFVAFAPIRPGAGFTDPFLAPEAAGLARQPVHGPEVVLPAR